jgi:hypothetical protein
LLLNQPGHFVRLKILIGAEVGVHDLGIRHQGDAESVGVAHKNQLSTVAQKHGTSVATNADARVRDFGLDQASSYKAEPPLRRDIV